MDWLCIPPCTAGLCNTACYHALMIPNMLISIKNHPDSNHSFQLPRNDFLLRGVESLKILRGANFKLFAASPKRRLSVRLSLTSGRGLSLTDSNYRKRLVYASEADYEQAFTGHGYKNLSRQRRDLDARFFFGEAFRAHHRSIQRGSVIPQKAT
jgi:hypothetical protein